MVLGMVTDIRTHTITTMRMNTITVTTITKSTITMTTITTITKTTITMTAITTIAMTTITMTTIAMTTIAMTTITMTMTTITMTMITITTRNMITMIMRATSKIPWNNHATMSCIQSIRSHLKCHTMIILQPFNLLRMKFSNISSHAIMIEKNFTITLRLSANIDSNK